MTLKVKINNPIINDLELTYLSQNIANTTSIPVISSDFFVAPNDLIIIGNEQYDNCELRTVASISSNTIVTTVAAKNSHITGEKVRKLLFNKIKLYKKTIVQDDYTLLATIDITYNNPDSFTVYSDSLGTNTDSYKAQYLNSVSSDESELSDAFSGADIDSDSKYLTVSEFRKMTGIMDSEIPDSVLSEFLARSSRDLKRYAFAKDKEFRIKPKTKDDESRYYFPFTALSDRVGYLTDWNLDGVVNTSDITVYEKSSDDFTINDITAQVDELDINRGYFTLNTGYPSSTEYGVYVTYAWMNFPIMDADTKYDVRRYLMHQTMCYIIEWYRNQLRRGISKQTLGGLTVEKNLTAWETLYADHEEKAMKMINRFKPLLWSTAKDQSGLEQSTRYYGYSNYQTPSFISDRNPW
jgi:hypothetical protein